MADDMELQDWIGRNQVAQDLLRAQPAQFMQATLDQTPSLTDGDPLPSLWHWLYFLEAARASELGRDAHPKKGGFLPPVSLPRRMWAGGRLTFHAPLILGKAAQKRSTIQSITEKSGRSGSLCFVTVAHDIIQDGQCAVTEEQDIVYREDPAPGAPTPQPAPAPDDPDVSRQVTPTEVMLFRYSALTFNGHRIHYDVDYARQVEGYDGLVFHGPLTATLLADLACTTMNKPLKRFEFRGVAPLSGLTLFHIEGRHAPDKISLWAKRQDGALAMSATAEF